MIAKPGRVAATIRRWGWLALGLWFAAVGTAAAETWVVGPGGTPMALPDALARAADGDTIEMLAGDYPGGLVLQNRRLTFRAMGRAIVRGDANKLSAFKALWTVQGGQVVIEGLEFRGMRAQDGGGAGVRQEGGQLKLLKAQFFDNEYGVLAQNDDKAELTIEACAFGAAPRVVGGLYHLLNVGRIGKLSVTGSRFQQGFEGHLIKSRAREAFVAYNMIHDGVRGGASYEVEFANGGIATLLGNVIGQGADNQNPVLVAFGTEGNAWEKNELRVVHNTFINYGWLPAWFLRVVKDRLPENTQVWAVNNLLVGPGIFWLGAPGHFEGNRSATRGMLADIYTGGFELPLGSMWRDAGVDPRKVGGQDMSPKAEFEWPAGTREIRPGQTSWTPGAFQR